MVTAQSIRNVKFDIKIMKKKNNLVSSSNITKI